MSGGHSPSNVFTFKKEAVDPLSGVGRHIDRDEGIPSRRPGAVSLPIKVIIAAPFSDLLFGYTNFKFRHAC
jgi:hypothetical protein